MKMPEKGRDIVVRQPPHIGNYFAFGAYF